MDQPTNSWDLGDGLTMTLDGVEHRFHIREADNRIQIVVSQPGWAASTNSDFWYVSVEYVGGFRLETGEVSSGASFAEAMKTAKEWYMREAKSAIEAKARYATRLAGQIAAGKTRDTI